MYWLTKILPQRLHFHLFLIVDCSRLEGFSCPSVVEGINSLIIVSHIVKVFQQRRRVLHIPKWRQCWWLTDRKFWSKMKRVTKQYLIVAVSPPPLGYTNDITKWNSRFHMDKFSGLEYRIRDKIQQTKHKMHQTRERAITDRLWSEIETLNWVLNEILSLSRKT